MIGFEMSATGSGGFRQKRAAWTEGSLMALKVIGTAGSLVNKDQLHSTQRSAISAIEASFSKIAKSRFDAVCACGLSFTLFMKGDIAFKYYFDSSKKSDQIKSELYNQFAAATDGGIGDQVMIYFCAIVNDFVLTNFDSTGKLSLTIDVDL